jgi:hypothetical protein
MYERRVPRAARHRKDIGAWSGGPSDVELPLYGLSCLPPKARSRPVRKSTPAGWRT